MIVNVAAPVTPPDVVTVTPPDPGGALAAIVNVAVICVPLATTTLLTVTPAGAFTAAPATKLLPFSVTATAVPATPDEGLTPVSPGGGGTMVKPAAGEVPPAVVTVTVMDPSGAVGGIVNVAVS